MTKKRCYIILGILTACVCVLWAVAAMIPPRPGVTKANFDRIHEGMTLTETKAMLGNHNGLENPLRAGDRVCWHGEDGATIMTRFDFDNILIEKVFVKSTETFTAKLRRWLHLPK